MLEPLGLEFVVISRQMALIGCGEIARKQHARFLQSRDNDTGLRLVATADPHNTLPGFSGTHYPDPRAMLAAEPGLTAVSITSPTATHFAVAKEALLMGRHVLLEKPPTATLDELKQLERIAAEQRVVLVTSFHACHNAAVRQLRDIYSRRSSPEHIAIEWREDFERWHAGQAWPWRPGGFGVFDSGINALSILCHVLPDIEFRVEHAQFRVPEGAATPASVEMHLSWDGGTGEVAFEWRKGGSDDVWDMSVLGADEAGKIDMLCLRDVRTLLKDSTVLVTSSNDEEYAGVYLDFSRAIDAGIPRVSLKEMRIIEDAAMIAEVECSKTRF